jgi:hypothetical protein
MVNTLFIKGLLKSYSDFDFKFFGEQNHIKLVSDNLHTEKKIIFKSINIPKRGASNARRLIDELKLVSNIFLYTKKVKSDKIIFLSCTEAGIFCIKILSIFFNKIEVFIVLHSVIETIDKKEKTQIWEYPFNLHFILSAFKSKNIKFILFNKFSLMRFIKKFPKLSPFFHTIEFPFEFNTKEKKNVTLINNENKIVFASIGDFNKRKNSNLFFDLANQHYNLNSIYEFWFIGRTEISGIDLKNVHLVSSDNMLDDINYHHNIEAIDYAIFLFNSDFYRYSVSGTLYDAVLHTKPILAIRTPFFQDFFLRYGNIGYLCDSYDDMLDLINSNNIKKNSLLYLEQQSNLQKARKDLNDNFYNSLFIFN